MNEREQLLARIKQAKQGYENALTDCEKKTWLTIHNKLVLKHNRLGQGRAGAKLKVNDRK
jgi:hypothetical protein